MVAKVTNEASAELVEALQLFGHLSGFYNGINGLPLQMPAWRLVIFL